MGAGVQGTCSQALARPAASGHRLPSAGEALGGLSRIARQVLQAADHAKAAKVRQRKLTPGTRLVRDWHGMGHSVTVLEDGFHFDERHWPSLTAIARHITGAKWSGPRFFGLTGGAS